jgi:hypothetical protein
MISEKRFLWGEHLLWLSFLIYSQLFLGMIILLLNLLDITNAKEWKVDAYAGVGRVVQFGPPSVVFSGDGGQAVVASMTSPYGVWMRNFGGSQQLYIADNGNNRLRVVDTASGIITSVASVTTQGIKPWHMCGDTSGNVYVADYNTPKLYRISVSGVLTTYAGTGE